MDNSMPYRRLSTVLAALRYMQANLDDVDELELDHFADCTRLTEAEIDELCEELDMGDLVIRAEAPEELVADDVLKVSTDGVKSCRYRSDQPNEANVGKPRLVVRGVAYHEQDGVYLGSFIGLGLWSKLDSAGQTSACVFPDEAIMREWAATVESAKVFSESRFVVVETADPHYATMAECVAAGLPAWEV